MKTGLELRKTAAWTLLVTCTALVAVVLWSLFSLSLPMRDRKRQVEEAVAASGRTMARTFPNRPAPNPGVPVRELAGPTEEGAPDQVVPVRMALYLGGNLIWAAPPGTPPYVPAPAGEKEQVSHRGSLWYYVYALEDGRHFVAVFEAPAYQRARRQMLLTSSIVLAGVLALVFVWLWLAVKLYRSYRSLEGSLGEAGRFLAGGERGDTSQTMVGLFQQTLSELKKRSAELESLHQRERQRADDVEGFAEALSSNLEAGLLRFDQEGRLSGVNAMARSLLALPQVPRLGDAHGALLRGRPEVMQVLEDAMQSKTLSVRDEVPSAPGVFLQAAAIPLFNLTHQLRGYLLILRDLSPLYEMRKTLREREALTHLGEVAAGVAHEVRNTLSTFSGQLRLLGQDNSGITSDPHFQGLVEESRKLEQVVQNLLFFARPLPLAPETVLLRPVLEEEAGALRSSFPSVHTAVWCDPSLEAVFDREACTRALRNLARNAAEAVSSRPDGGLVRFSGTREGRRVLLSVEDDGPGLSPEALAQLFTPFSSQKQGGTGLGLAIARKIAREHGGDLTYAPSELGGARFVLAMPCDPREEGARWE